MNINYNVPFKGEELELISAPIILINKPKSARDDITIPIIAKTFPFLPVFFISFIDIIDNIKPGMLPKNRIRLKTKPDIAVLQ